MRHFAGILTMLGISMISLLAARPVLAIPPLPSSFYGTVKVNGSNITDGTLVQASINEKIIVEAQTQTYQSDSVYSLDIPGDDTDTLVVEGGKDGESITFMIGGIVADQMGTWKSGAIVSLNLSASSAAILIPAQATLTPIPTQTAIILGAVTPSLLATEPQSSTIKPVLSLVSPLPTTFVPATTTISTGTNPENDLVISRTTIIVIGIVLSGAILFTILWLIHVRKTKVE